MIEKISEHVYRKLQQPDTDRPHLYLVVSDNRSMAIDAGNSAAHVREFYRELEEAGLPLPAYTVLTHAHWDHSYGLWATAGTSLCGKKTWDKINEMTGWEWTEEAMNRRLQTKEEIPFCHENIRKEYTDLSEIHVVTPDISFDKELTLHLGNVTVRAIETENPHEEDGVLIAVDDLLILGDSSSPDYYHLNEKYDRTRLANYLAQLKTYKGYRLVHSHIDEILPLEQYIRMVEENASETGYVQ